MTDTQATTYSRVRVKTWIDDKNRGRQTTKEFKGELKEGETYLQMVNRVDAEADAWDKDVEAGK